MELHIGFEFEEFGIELLDAGQSAGSAITAIDAKGKGGKQTHSLHRRFQA